MRDPAITLGRGVRSLRTCPAYSVLVALGAALLSALQCAAAPVDFSLEVLPILSENCFHCHGPDANARKAKLRLDTKEGAFQKNEDGVAAIVPGNHELSTLVSRIFSTDSEELMPPPKSNRKLTEQQRSVLKQWVGEGAKWGVHWAFAPLQKPDVPSPGGAHPIDAFVKERLKKDGLDLQARASRRTLLRRLSLDLTGLPPTPEEVALFDADTEAEAIPRVVDRLLASPRFGERMAWEWLDAARYADTNGYQGDSERTMWPWRDWVVNAFNRNLSYDDFTVWQLAGDLLPEATQEQILATGFLRNHPINGEGGRIAEENRVDYVMDMAETSGTVWLGLTLNCCRCHDHKYDPLLQSDYYRFFGFFNQTPVTGGGGDPQMAPRLDVPQGNELAALETSRTLFKESEARATDLWKASSEKRAQWSASLVGQKGQAAEGVFTQPKTPELRNALLAEEAKWTSAQRKLVEEAWEVEDADFKKARADRDSKRDATQRLDKALTRVMVMADAPKARQTFMLSRGLYNQPGEEVSSGVPLSLNPFPEGQPNNRLGLARWMVGGENPLMARVTVNRFWQQFFGIGLVKTSEDFGVQAEKPVHKELLDWLAAEFRDGGWNVKALVRLIVTSETYLQSSQCTEESLRNDPQNRLLGRGARFRMPAWMIRDQALGASGLLSQKTGGAPVKPYQPQGVWEEATFGNKVYKQDQGEGLYRRSLYTFWRRIVGPTLFFDTGNRATCSVKPLRTNTPLHALHTLNDPTYVEASRTLAEGVLKGGLPDFASRLRAVYERVLCREPSESEVKLWSASYQRHFAFYNANPKEAGKLLAVGASLRDASVPLAAHAAYTTVCLSVFNLDEALTKE